MNKPKQTKRTFTVEFVETEKHTSFDMIAKAIAGAIRKELTDVGKERIRRAD